MPMQERDEPATRSELPSDDCTTPGRRDWLPSSGVVYRDDSGAVTTDTTDHHRYCRWTSIPRCASNRIYAWGDSDCGPLRTLTPMLHMTFNLNNTTTTNNNTNNKFQHTAAAAAATATFNFCLTGPPWLLCSYSDPIRSVLCVWR